MKKSVCLFVAAIFFVAVATPPAHAHRRRGGGGGVNWGTVAGIGIFAALLGYVATRKSDIQEKGIDEEYRTQRYKIDADTTLAAPSALGDRESSDWDRPHEGKARIYSPLPVKYSLREEPRSVGSTERSDGSEEDHDKHTSYAQKKSLVSLSDTADLESLYGSLNTYGATRRELQALLHGIEEVRDTRKSEFSRRQLRDDLDYLYSLQEKILREGTPIVEFAALEKLIKYIESVVSRKEVS